MSNNPLQDLVMHSLRQEAAERKAAHDRDPSTVFAVVVTNLLNPPAFEPEPDSAVEQGPAPAVDPSQGMSAKLRGDPADAFQKFLNDQLHR